jgi:hypothetical protein
MLIASAAQADGPDISAQRLLSSWQDEDPSMRMVAEVIASAFASGFSWGGDAAGKRVYGRSLGQEVMMRLGRTRVAIASVKPK